MRNGVFLLLVLMLAAFTVRADETLPFLKVGPDVYTNVTITKVTKTDVYFTSASGMGNAKLKNLDREMQQHFNFDAAGAATEARKKAADSAVAKSAGTPAASSSSGTPKIDRANAQAVMDGTIAKVKAIVNQPVRQLPRTPEMTDVAEIGPIWFHDGAVKPEFDLIDVTETQQPVYDKHKYVTSDLNPGVVFVGKELAYNGETKYFYTDRSVPKKKLTHEELLEINRLYRIIGQCEAALDPSKQIDPPMFSLAFLSQHKLVIIISAAVVLGIALALKFLTGGRAEQ